MRPKGLAGMDGRALLAMTGEIFCHREERSDPRGLAGMDCRALIAMTGDFLSL